MALYKSVQPRKEREMSADTTVVIAACCRFPDSSELSYTAAVVQAAESLFDEEYGLTKAKANFINTPCVWFSGPGGFSRAKQFANILAGETRENGILEYEDRPIIEIAEDGVHELSRKGKRKQPVQWGKFSDPSEPWMQDGYGIESVEQIPDRTYHF